MIAETTQTFVGPSAAQKAWMDLGYGMFIHFGPNTFTNQGWGDGKFPASSFEPTKLDVAQWAGVAAEAGMKYAVLTTKHHDGFCLWPSEHTAYSVANSPRRQDIVGMYIEEFRKAGLKPGLYYSLWDLNYPQYENDEVYAHYMRDQITELLTNYGPIVEMWFDGGWDKDHPTKMCWWEEEWLNDPNSGYTPGDRWGWKELYELIHSLQPDCLVLNNSSSDRPGAVRYHPIDARTAEHFNFVFRDEIRYPNYNEIWTNDDGEQKFLPLEFCASLALQWFWQGTGGEMHPSVATICDWHNTARSNNANLLLNVGPDVTGRVPEYNSHFLRAARRLGNF
ncbi:hypothetical protein EON83_09995 [bacterium]|nr:MAG: hypothetical protein EON83_09995 [bacterium]